MTPLIGAFLSSIYMLKVSIYIKQCIKIKTRYSLTIHLYADDTQIYFSIDINCDQPDLTQVENCLQMDE